MTKVIVCGSRTIQDIKMLVDSGADAIGLITEVWQDVPCNLTRAEAREFTTLIPPLIPSILIITEENTDEILRMVDFIRPDILQLQGFNPASDIKRLKNEIKAKIVKVLHVDGDKLAEGKEPVKCALTYIEAGANMILLDTYQPGKVGATGATSNLTLAREIRDGVFPAPLVLAGGLSIGNLVNAINMVKPYAVDVFSGVVTNGYLDAQKVKQFVKKARSIR